MSEEATPRKEYRFIDWFQGGILADRYLETILADWKNTGLLLLQAPFLAGLAVLVQSNVGRGSHELYFVMTLSVFWIGCMDACREVVKERALFLREKMAGLDVGAYLYSKIRVLTLLSCVQAFAYALIVSRFVDVRIPIGWLSINLIASTICGACLGLLISSVVSRSDYAVALVPMAIVPQLLFSEFMIAKDQFAGLSKAIYLVMPSRWGYESLLEFADTADRALAGFGKLFPLVALGVLFLALAYPVLRAQKY